MRRLIDAETLMKIGTIMAIVALVVLLFGFHQRRQFERLVRKYPSHYEHGTHSIGKGKAK